MDIMFQRAKLLIFQGQKLNHACIDVLITSASTPDNDAIDIVTISQVQL